MVAGTLAIVVRLGVFLSALALLPGKAVPFTAQAALGFAMLFFALPGLQLDSTLGASGLLSLQRASLEFDARLILLESTVGLLMAVAVSFAAYGARAGARWVALTAHGAYFDQASRGNDPGLERILSGVELLVLLVFLTALLRSPDTVTAIFGLVSDSLEPSVLRTAFGAQGSGLAGVVSYAGSAALSMALLFALPAFVIALTAQSCALVAARYASRAATTSVVAAVTLPLVLFVLSLCLYPFVASLRERFDATISNDHVQKTVQSAVESGK